VPSQARLQHKLQRCLERGGDQWPGPSYNVVGGSKPVEGVATWALAADYANTYGGKVRAIRPNPS
jgi:hypothetical protein